MERKNEKVCPYCGAALPESASFCPHCSRIINQRQFLVPPRRLPQRIRRVLTLTVLTTAAVLALALWQNTRPKIYDNGGAEVLYTDKDGTYQLCIAWDDARTSPAQRRVVSLSLDSPTRFPVMLYINQGEENAADAFLEKTAEITAQVERDSSQERLMASCTEAKRMPDYLPAAASVTFLDVAATFEGTYEAALVYTVRMKNGDVIHLYQQENFQTVKTWTYTQEDAPMGTIEELQALVDSIPELVGENDEVEIMLPPVTYSGGLTLPRAMTLVGSSDGQNRTTFTGETRVDVETGWISYFRRIDFVGDGHGTGISTNRRFHLENCRVAGWETGAACSGVMSWVNVEDTVFENNEIGFRMDGVGSSASRQIYAGNVFQGNGTGVLIENFETDLSLSFPGTRFSGNDTDIDNRCGQTLDLSEAVFE